LDPKAKSLTGLHKAENRCAIGIASTKPVLGIALSVQGGIE
jgi:hypothetical protein